MRLRWTLRERLESYAARSRRSVSDVTQELLEEAIRMRDCPGIYFASEPSGRTAKVQGTGLGVWEILRDYVHDKNAKRLRRAFAHLSGAQISAALMYYGRHTEEIDREIAENDALTPEALEILSPRMVRVVDIG
jgi:uncharacterized protein (DUF433 family)